MRLAHRKWVVAPIVVAIAIGLTFIGIYSFPLFKRHREAQLARKPQAPPDLEKLRDAFASGLDAVQRSDGVDAVRHLSSFDFGERAVEEYRLYYLANAHELAADGTAARRILAKLWSRQPQLVYREDVAFHLASLYAAAGDWTHKADTLVALAAQSDSPETAAAARWDAVTARLCESDLPGLLENARNIAIRSPRAEQAASALAVVRAVTGSDTVSLTTEERLERAVALLRDDDPRSALEELEALVPDAPLSLKLTLQLNRGLALAKLADYEDSNKLLEPLASGAYKYAIPAIYTASRNYRTLAASINPFVYKTILQRRKVGTVKFRVGKGKRRHLVTRPKYAKVKTTVRLVDSPKMAKKEDYNRRAAERLKDLLLLPLAESVRLEVLRTLIALAEAKNQDEYEQKLVREVVQLDRGADPGLQHFWDKAWLAYTRGDLNAARPLLQFIADTYNNPNAKRQAEYWYARSIERAGEREEAAAIYQNLAASPYEDLYTLHAEARGAPHQSNGVNPIRMIRPDWRNIADNTMPPELRLAYELTALSDMRDARLEIQKNVTQKNQRYADALLADLHGSGGNLELMYRSLRRAFPQLATVEQDSVPPYFLKMYYPLKYKNAIWRYSSRNGLDPYLLMALILQESSFNPKARSPVGAIGLMQLMPATGNQIGKRLHGVFSASRLEDPETNIEVGTVHLRHLVNLFGGNTQLAVASYNAGQGNVLRWRHAASGKPMDEFLESIPFAETRNYVKRVTMLRSAYRRLDQ